MVNPDNVSDGFGSGIDIDKLNSFMVIFLFVLVIILLIIVFYQYAKISNLKDKLKETNYSEKEKE